METVFWLDSTTTIRDRTRVEGDAFVIRLKSGEQGNAQLYLMGMQAHVDQLDELIEVLVSAKATIERAASNE